MNFPPCWLSNKVQEVLSPPHIVRGHYMVSEVNKKPRKHGSKRHRMPSYAVGRRQPDRKLAAFQATRRVNVYRTEQEKCSYLLICVGQKGRDIYNTWSDISDDDRKKLGTYYKRFENHVSP